MISRSNYASESPFPRPGYISCAGLYFSAFMEFPPPSVLAHVVDVHCHPTDTDIPDGFPDDLHITICAMSTRTRDQPLVRDIATRCPDKVIPAFGECVRIPAVVSLASHPMYLWAQGM